MKVFAIKTEKMKDRLIRTISDKSVILAEIALFTIVIIFTLCKVK